MKQTQFNIYFICSMLWTLTMSLTALTDTERNYIDNSIFISLFIICLLNVGLMAHLFNKTPKNN